MLDQICTYYWDRASWVKISYFLSSAPLGEKCIKEAKGIQISPYYTNESTLKVVSGLSLTSMAHCK